MEQFRIVVTNIKRVHCHSLYCSSTQWTWVWVNSRSWWWTWRPGILQSMGSQSRTWLSNWTELNCTILLVLDVDFFLAMNYLIRRLLINSSVFKIFLYMSLIIETNKHIHPVQFNSVQSISCVQLFVTPWTTVHQASLSITNSQGPPKPMSIESVMPSNHLILWCPLLLLPSIFPSIRVFSNESALHIRGPKYWGFNFNISPSTPWG